MFSTKLLILLVLLVAAKALSSAEENLGFTYCGFQSANLSLDGAAKISSDGLLTLTNDSMRTIGHAFYTNPFTFKKSLQNTTTNVSSFSFSTTFVFAVRPEYVRLGGHGIAFVIAPTKDLPGALPSQYLGLFNLNTTRNASNHVFAIELDNVQDYEFNDIDDNHVGIDINGLQSERSAAAGYYSENGKFLSLDLKSGKPMQVWVEYDAVYKQINVTLAPDSVTKPDIPLLSLNRDLSEVLNDAMYVGFSSSTGLLSSSHYIQGWSFKINGQAQDLILSPLPKLPRMGPKKISKLLTIGLPLLSVFLVTLAVSVIAYVIERKRKFAELIEDWELDFGPQSQRYKYKDLYIATKGFRDRELLGRGGFGSVYRGVLPKNNIEIAVKKVSHNSRQGVREFVAEIVSMGRLRHRNLVLLLGYCRRKGELLLVYDFMTNGSLDKLLFDNPKTTLNWNQRYRIIKGVASGLLYLHEEWEQVVVHRDVKASNELLDAELNGRLGDFGLARLYDHGTDPHTTRVVGTLGYMAPENTRIGKATTSSDVFAFGAFLLEVACGRRPIDSRVPPEDAILVDRVCSCWNRGDILEAMDQNLGVDFVADEVELVLKLGLLCSNSEPSARPSMRRVVEHLEKHVPMPDLPRLGLSANGLTFVYFDGFDDFVANICTYKTSIAESLLSGGR